MSTTDYFGKAGHLYAMSEFLLRRYNVAIPEVDTGDDIFVVHDQRDRLFRVQVKAANAYPYAYAKPIRFRADHSVRRSQVSDDPAGALHFILLARWMQRWESMLILPHRALNAAYLGYKSHTKSSKLKLDLYDHTDGRVTWGNNKNAPDFQQHERDWTSFPML